MDQEQGTNFLQHRRKDSGLLVLAPPLRVLHVNQLAVEFMKRLSAFENHQANEPSATSFLPAPLLQFSTELVRLTEDRAKMKNFDQFEMRHIINSRPEPMRLRGFVLPDHGEWDQSRLIILLEEIGACEDEVGTRSR